MFRDAVKGNGSRKLSLGPIVEVAGWFALMLLAVGLTLCAFALAARAQGDGEEIPFEEADIFFELNNTDGDLGIHALIDGEAWKKLEIENRSPERVRQAGSGGRAPPAASAPPGGCGRPRARPTASRRGYRES